MKNSRVPVNSEKRLRNYLAISSFEARISNI